MNCYVKDIGKIIRMRWALSPDDTSKAAIYTQKDPTRYMILLETEKGELTIANFQFRHGITCLCGLIPVYKFGNLQDGIPVSSLWDKSGEQFWGELLFYPDPQILVAIMKCELNGVKCHRVPLKHYHYMEEIPIPTKRSANAFIKRTGFPWEYDGAGLKNKTGIWYDIHGHRIREKH